MDQSLLKLWRAAINRQNCPTWTYSLTQPKAASKFYLGKAMAQWKSMTRRAQAQSLASPVKGSQVEAETSDLQNGEVVIPDSTEGTHF